ncbi:AAA family ATPase [Bradyrhizobium sp. 172]|uniref:AAA family ATPase n=1 Tax=Bradyrhizobium sp. 172 TaxID=2782643 RepID=UPI001FFEB210|nr:AAA family ATPase [Bradyrhizobium sp. 172]UPJ95049.1 AAA family ATPase [Bradyrhizobium sp. 172]
MIQLSYFEVDGLFGVFNHRITFRTNERITIIHAPNGFGKTAVLKMIAGFFGGSLLVFRQYEFSSVRFIFSDGRAVRIEQSTVEPNDKRRAKERRYDLFFDLQGEELERWSPWDEKNIKELPERLRYEFVASDGRILRDPRTGQLMDPAEAWERFAHYYPRAHRGSLPARLEETRQLFDCRLIDTQRLMVRSSDKASASRDAKIDFIPAVLTFSQDVSQAIKNAIQQSAAITSSLDQTFPNRLLARGKGTFKPLPEGPLRARLADLLKLRARLRKAGLLDKGEEDTVLSPVAFDQNTRRILTLYLFDSVQKLEVFNELLAKIETFLGIINKRFQFKKLALDKDQGFVLTDFRGQQLEPNDLSSGEQHELVLIYELLFKTKPNSLLLIDEPEISLHIAWQKHVLPDLKQIISLAPMDVILATHSPQLASGSLGLIETLKAPALK